MTAALDLRKVIEEILVPGIQDIRLKVSTIEVEIRRLDEKIDNLRGEFRSDILRLEEKIDGLQKEFRSDILRLDEKIDGFRGESRSDTLRLDQKIDSFQGESRSDTLRLDEKIATQWESLNDKIAGQDAKWDERFRSLAKQIEMNREDFRLAIDIHERLAAVEAKLSSN